MNANKTELISLLLFINDLERLLRRNRLTLRRMWYRGDFPKPCGRINNRLYWKANVVEQWLQNK